MPVLSVMFIPTNYYKYNGDSLYKHKNSIWLRQQTFPKPPEMKSLVFITFLMKLQLAWWHMIKVVPQTPRGGQIHAKDKFAVSDPDHRGNMITWFIRHPAITAVVVYSLNFSATLTLLLLESFRSSKVHHAGHQRWCGQLANCWCPRAIEPNGM